MPLASLSGRGVPAKINRWSLSFLCACLSQDGSGSSKISQSWTRGGGWYVPTVVLMANMD